LLFVFVSCSGICILIKSEQFCLVRHFWLLPLR